MRKRSEATHDAGQILPAFKLARMPPHVFFCISAIFHYLGPACAVLLFARLEPLGVAWLRIAAAAICFALWRRPWRTIGALSAAERRQIIAMGCVLAAMNASFYLAISRLPLGTVGAIEFIGPIGLAAAGARCRRNWTALLLAIAGIGLLTDLRLVEQWLGYVFAVANCLLFVLYIVLGHRLAATGGVAGIDRLAMGMMVAMLAALPVGINEALPAFIHLPLLLAAIGVGIASSVIPYVCDQLAMARLPRATFALFLSLLSALATVMGIVVLRQIPSMIEVGGIALVVAGVALHRPDAGCR